eukprot:UN05596
MITKQIPIINMHINLQIYIHILNLILHIKHYHILNKIHNSIITAIVLLQVKNQKNVNQKSIMIIRPIKILMVGSSSNNSTTYR